MFAEDVGLLKGEVFTTMLRDRWIPNPDVFPSEIEELWRVMNTGGTLFGLGRILQFNGSFFENATAIALPKEQLEVLYAAAAKDWSQVEPAIFGTLLERALEKKERSQIDRQHMIPVQFCLKTLFPRNIHGFSVLSQQRAICLKALSTPKRGGIAHSE
jgi:hypothetical protein